MERADLVVAVTGDDEDNLTFCQIAKAKFNVPRAVARINNPQNEGLFMKLGIDATVSATSLIMAHIEQELPWRGLIPLLTLRAHGLEIVEVQSEEASPGKIIKDLVAPSPIVRHRPDAAAACRRYADRARTSHLRRNIERRAVTRRADGPDGGRPGYLGHRRLRRAGGAALDPGHLAPRSRMAHRRRVGTRSTGHQPTRTSPTAP
jgi:hypothetical protein